MSQQKTFVLSEQQTFVLSQQQTSVLSQQRTSVLSQPGWGQLGSAKIDFDPFFTPKMTRMEHAGGAGAAPEMESRLPLPRLTQRARGQDYVSSKQTPSKD